MFTSAEILGTARARLESLGQRSIATYLSGLMNRPGTPFSAQKIRAVAGNSVLESCGPLCASCYSSRGSPKLVLPLAEEWGSLLTVHPAAQTMAAIRPIPPQMILKEETDQGLLFQFQSVRWAIGTFLVASCFAMAAYYGFTQSGPLLGSCLAALAALLGYSSVYSWTASQWLEMDAEGQTARYVEQNLYRRVDKTIPFSDFKQIRVFRPSVSSRTAMNWVTALEASDEEPFIIGCGEFGALSHAAAKELAERVAKMMNIPFADPGPDH